MVLPLLGAFASIGGAALGADATNKAAAYNHASDVMNYNLRNQERFDTIQQSREANRNAKLGTTDAQGNSVKFIEGVGWVEEQGEQAAILQALYDREEKEAVGNDLQIQRQRLNSNDDRQGQEDVMATGLLEQFRQVQRGDPRDLEGSLNNASAKGIHEGFDSALEDAMRSSIRTGASNSGYIAADVGKARASALEQAFAQNKQQARTQTQSEYDSERANLANMYNMFATRSTAMPGVGYNPRNLQGQGAAAMQGAAGRETGTMNALINAMAKNGGSMPRIQPNMGAANALSSSGGVLASLGERMQAGSNKQNAYDQMGNYARTGNMVRQSSGAY